MDVQNFKFWLHKSWVTLHSDLKSQCESESWQQPVNTKYKSFLGRNRASLSLAIEHGGDNWVFQVHPMLFIYKRCTQKSILVLLSLFENLGTYALEYGHLKIHHDFKVLTLRKDGIMSLSLHDKWWVRDFTKSLHLSPQNLRTETVAEKSFFLLGHADSFNIAQMFLVPLHSCHFAWSWG